MKYKGHGLYAFITCLILASKEAVKSSFQHCSVFRLPAGRHKSTWSTRGK